MSGEKTGPWADFTAAMDRAIARAEADRKPKGLRAALAALFKRNGGK